MKISCQSCHSKYNVADEKIQGKIVKIRCRKCGATIVVNASAAAPANGSGMSTAPTEPGGAVEWHVSVAEKDQRTMGLAELVGAYHSGVVTQETFIWSDGMDDWKPLGEVEAVVAALHMAAAQAKPPPTLGGYAFGASAQAERSPAFEPPGQPFAQPAMADPEADLPPASAEPKRAAVVKREARARDLFATRSGEELNSIAPLGQADAAYESKLTGQRNENSVLFSLEHLTKNAEDRPQPGEALPASDDSGIIDLKALAARAESMRPPVTAEVNALSAPLGFSSPLTGPFGAVVPSGPTTPQKSKLPMLIGAAAGIAVLLVVGIVIALRIGGNAGPTTTATGDPSALPSSTSSAPEPSASAAAASPPQASASAAPASSLAATTQKPHPVGGAAWHMGPPGAAAAGPRPAAGAGVGAVGAAGTSGGGAGAATSGAAGGGGTGAGAAGGTSPPSPKKNDCNCNGDLMCMMKCSTH